MKMSTLGIFTTLTRRIKTLKYIRSSSNRFVSSDKGDGEYNIRKYTSKEQLFIIDNLHKCVENNIIRTYLTGKRLRSLRTLFEESPNLTTLEPLLTINGLGPKLLHRICDSILENPVDVNNKSTSCVDSDSESDTQKLKVPNLLTPSHIHEVPVECVVSIHLGINAISWARLQSATGQLDTWDFMDMSYLVDKKFDVHTVWKLVTQLREQIPNGDIYVMENSNWTNVANIKKPMKYHIQQAMITTAICSIFNQTDSGGELRSTDRNRLHFLRQYTPFRLFKKIVGNERVSAQDVVQNIIDGVEDKRHQPITFVNGTSNHYLGLNGSLRDNMCHALLLAVSFTELIVLENMLALKGLGKPPPKKRNSN